MAAARFEVFLEGEEDGFSTQLDAKWLAKPLLKALIIPFLNSLKSKRKNPLYAAKHLTRVEVNGRDLPLTGSMGVNSPAKYCVPIAMDELTEPITVVIGLFSATMSVGLLSSPAPMSPASPARRSKVSLVGGSLIKRASSKTTVHVRSHGVEMGTTLTKRWAEQTVRDAIIVPFFKQYEQSRYYGGDSAPCSDNGIASISLDAHDGEEPVVHSQEDDLERVLSSPVAQLASGALLEINITIRGHEGMSATGMADCETGSGEQVPEFSKFSGNHGALDRARRANSQRRHSLVTSEGALGGNSSQPAQAEKITFTPPSPPTLADRPPSPKLIDLI